MADEDVSEPIREAIRRMAERERGIPDTAPAVADPKKSFWDHIKMDDAIVFITSELIALPFAFNGADAFMKNDYWQFGKAYSIALPFAVVGFTFHFWKKWIGWPARQWIETAAYRWWPLTLVLAFAYILGPDIYQRATEPRVSPGVQLLSASVPTDDAFEGRPLGVWWRIALLRVNTGDTTSISAFTVQAKNLSSEEINLKAAYLVSGIDGTQIPLSVSAYPEGLIHIDDAGAVPPGAEFEFAASFPEQGEAAFLQKWAHFFVVIEAGDQKIRHEITAENVRTQIDWAKGPAAQPHITRRKS